MSTKRRIELGDTVWWLDTKVKVLNIVKHGRTLYAYVNQSGDPLDDFGEVECNQLLKYKNENNY